MDIELSDAINSNSAPSRSSLALLIDGSSLVFVGVAANRVLEFTTRIVFSRALGTTDFGFIFLGQTLLGILAGLIVLGFPTAIVKDIARFDAVQNIVGIRRTIGTSLWILFPISLIAALLGILFSDGIATTVFHEQRLGIVLSFFSIALPFYVVLRIFLAIVEGFKDARAKVAIEDIFLPAARLIVASLALAFGAGLVGVLAAFLIAFAVASIMVISPVRSRLKAFSTIFTSFDWQICKQLIVFSVPLAFSSIFSLIIWQLDTFFLQRYRDASEVGLYGAALTTVGAMLVILTALLYMYVPIVSPLISQRADRELRSLYGQVSRLSLIGSLPITLVLIFWGAQFLSIVFSPAYSEASTALSILAIGYLIHTVLGINIYHIILLGKTRLYLANTMIAAILDIILWSLLVPRFGLAGAALGTTSGMIVVSILCSGQSYYYLQNKPFRLAYLPLIGAAILLALGVSVIVDTIVHDVVAQFLMKVFLFLILYFLCVLKLHLFSRAEMSHFLRIVLRKESSEGI